MGSEVRRLWMFRGLDYKAAENYLNRQAERGLLLKKIGPQGIIAAFDRDESGKRSATVSTAVTEAKRRSRTTSPLPRTGAGITWPHGPAC